MILGHHPKLRLEFWRWTRAAAGTIREPAAGRYPARRHQVRGAHRREERGVGGGRQGLRLPRGREPRRPGQPRRRGAKG
jgi:hypothetical protein